MAEKANGQLEALPELAAWVEYQHQQAQQAIATQTATGLALLWPILNFGSLDNTTTAWLHAVTLQIEKHFRESETAAFDMVQGVKWAIEPDSTPLQKVVTTFPVKAVQESMKVTGPVHVKTQMPAAEDDVMARAKLTSTGAGVRHALNGGRGEVQNLISSDALVRRREGKVIGYKRVTDDKPCYFCAMLASRGATYTSADAFAESNSRIRETNKWRTSRRAFTGDGVAKVHDHCQCSIVPVYRTVDKYDERAKFFLAQWKEFTKGLSGKEAMNAFRARYVPPPPAKDAPTVDLGAVRANRQALIDGGFAAASPQVRWYDRQIKLLAI